MLKRKAELEKELAEINTKIALDKQANTRYEMLSRHREAKHREAKHSKVLESIASGKRTIVKMFSSITGEVIYKLIDPKTGESFDTYDIETLKQMKFKESDFTKPKTRILQ